MCLAIGGSGILYLVFGVLPIIFLWIGKAEMCDPEGQTASGNSSTSSSSSSSGRSTTGKTPAPEDALDASCPHPSVSDVEFRSPRRTEIVLTIILRVLVCCIVLLYQRAHQFQMFDRKKRDEVLKKRQKKYEKSVAAMAEGAPQPVGEPPREYAFDIKIGHRGLDKKDFALYKENELAKQEQWEIIDGEQHHDGMFMCLLLIWSFSDIIQVFLSNGSAYGAHVFFSHLAMAGFYCAHGMWFKTVVVTATEPKNIIAVLGVIMIIISFCMACFLMANLGNDDANVRWANTQWHGIGVQMGVIIAAGLTMTGSRE